MPWDSQACLPTLLQVWNEQSACLERPVLATQAQQGTNQPISEATTMGERRACQPRSLCSRGKSAMRDVTGRGKGARCRFTITCAAPLPAPLMSQLHPCCLAHAHLCIPGFCQGNDSTDAPSVFNAGFKKPLPLLGMHDPGNSTYQAASRSSCLACMHTANCSEDSSWCKTMLQSQPLQMSTATKVVQGTAS